MSLLCPQSRVQQSLRQSYQSRKLSTSIYQDPTGKDIILWEEIVGAFKGADNSSQYDSEDFAFCTSKEFDLPTTEPRPQTTPNDAIGGSQLHGHSSITHPSVDNNNHSSVVTNTPVSASPDADRIADLIAKADRGDMDAQIELRDAYETGKGLTMDHTSAMKYFRKAANRSHAMAQYRIGLLYQHGRGVEQNSGKATEWFRKADAQDLPQAQCQLGLVECSRREISSAMSYFLKAAKHGHAESEFHIAMLFKRGQGVRLNFEKAIECLRKAIEDDPGYEVALFEMGMMYYQGEGVPLDFPKAEELFVKAGNLGNVDGRRSLGDMYRNGRQGVAQDSVRAMEWFHSAADQNDMESQFTLGVMYDNGEGVVRDSSKAMEWYLGAAGQQHVEACFCIGVLYYDGWGGRPRDLAKAKEWFYRAAQRRHFEANDYLAKCGGQRVQLPCLV
ncbi:hypothetical protein EC957_004756 [Mortierella hygrophila]|uniref:HCP-like protein n=1 Tax=Mortierella hygrophila TaxID=979708 RepID=A0A9P6FF38_9FUNG|nr:hypothetical protein EC957_004756 [Mortierella hygrophila]